MRLIAPFTATKRTVESPTGPVLVRPFQIVIPVRLAVGKMLSPEFLAILDTGNNLNFSISEKHVREWIGVELKTRGKATVGGEAVQLKEAHLCLKGKMFPLREGIAVHDVRLPLLGLRALVQNTLNLSINSKKKTATISSGWF